MFLGVNELSRRELECLDGKGRKIFHRESMAIKKTSRQLTGRFKDNFRRKKAIAKVFRSSQQVEGGRGRADKKNTPRKINSHSQTKKTAERGEKKKK